MRCQAIKRDGLQCNYPSRFSTLYCGVHRDYTPSLESPRGRRIRRVPRFPVNDEITNIMDVIGVDVDQAIEIYIETLEIERKLILDKQMNSMINSFKSLDIPEEDCSICISPPDILVKTPCCKKEFCKDCLKSWIKIKKNCPACRAELS